MLSATFSLASRLPVALRFPSKIQQAAFSRQALRQSDVFKCSQAASQLVSQSVSQFVYVPSGRFTISHIPYIPYPIFPTSHTHTLSHCQPLLLFLAWLKATCVSEIMQNCLSGQHSSSSYTADANGCDWRSGAATFPATSIGLSNSFSRQVHLHCIFRRSLSWRTVHFEND